MFVLFSSWLYINDLEEVYVKSWLEGIDVAMFKIFLIQYADDIVIFANDSRE